MTDQQPEALRLADLIERYNAGVHSQAICEDYSQAAAELRRLHEENEHLKLLKCSFEMKLATRGYELQIDDLKARNAALEQALGMAVEALERCDTVLGNMAQENEGAIFNRWPIHHEPLRNDAKGLLPDLDAAIATARQTLGGAA